MMESLHEKVMGVVIMREMVMIIVLLFFVTTMCRSWWCGSCDEGIAA